MSAAWATPHASSIVAPASSAADRAVPSRENLERLAKLLEAGALTVPVQVTYPLDQADQAMEALTTRHTQGKVALSLS